MKRFIVMSSVLLVLSLGFIFAVAQDPPDPPLEPLPEDSIVTTINVSFSDPDPAEARAAQWYLSIENQSRVGQGREPFANVGEMCAAIIKRNVINWIEQEAEHRKSQQNIRELWRDATDAQRAAAIAALQAE